MGEGGRRKRKGVTVRGKEKGKKIRKKKLKGREKILVF
jgi:hypothetical protein